MPKTIQWIVNDSGIDHQIEVKSYAFKNDTLSVDGEPIQVPINLKNLLVMVDVTFKVGSKECHYIKSVDNKTDLIVDGVSQSTGKPYVKLTRTPWWAWLIMGTYLPLFLIGGFIPIFGGCFGIMNTFAYVRVPHQKTSTKVWICLAIDVLIYVIIFCTMVIWTFLFPNQ